MLTPRFTRTPHLVALIAEAEHLAATLELADPSPAGQQLWDEAAVATLRLDGSPIPGPPTAAQVAAARGAPRAMATTATRSSWADVIRTAEDVDAADDEILWTREYLAVVDALAADDIAERLVRDPLGAFADLHRRLTTGLVATDLAGSLRQTDQAVHDASVGRIVYYPSAPAAIPSELHRLAGWLASAAAREHGVIVSGLVHLDLLRIHPFESANGRLARIAARLLLRARGLDPHGLASPEVALADDSIGTYDEVARTMRRRDQTIWLERWGEAVTTGLRVAAQRLGMLVPDVPDRARDFLDHHDEPTFTIVDYRATARVEPDQARADLAELLDAGLVRRVLGARGLRFHVTSSPDLSRRGGAIR